MRIVPLLPPLALSFVVAACGTSSKLGFATPDGGSTASDDPSGTAGGHGLTLDGGTVDLDAACASIVEPTSRAPGAILIVLDRSFSMSDDPNDQQPKFGTPSKWDTAIPALTALVQSLPSGLLLGLEEFPSGSDGCSVDPQPAVNVADIATTRPIVISALNGAGPAGSTPTTPALSQAYSLLAALPNAGTRAVIFLSDGEPNCGSDETSVQSAVAGAFTKSGIQTYVVGIPGSPFTAFSRLAIAGGTRRDPACLEVCDASFADEARCCHYATDASDFQTSLVKALDDIAAHLRSDCVYKVPRPQSGSFDPSLVNVLASLDGSSPGNLVYQSSDPSADGWSYTDGSDTYLVIHGPLCQTILASPASKVEVVVGCPTQIK